VFKRVDKFENGYTQVGSEGSGLTSLMLQF